MLFLHWIGNRLLSLVTNVLYNTTLSDMETCYKLVDRTLLIDLGLRSRSLRHRARDHREDPEARDPHLRGPDLLHGPRVRRGQEDHVARRLRGVVDAREVPLWRLTTRPTGPVRRKGSVRAGRRSSSTSSPVRCSPNASRSLLADTSAGPMELVVVDNGSRDDSIADARRRASRSCVSSARPATSATRVAANLGTAATQGADRRGDQPRHRRGTGHGRRAGARDSNASRASRPCGPRLHNPDGSDYPSARTLPSIPVAIGHGLLGLWWPTNPFTTSVSPARRRPVRARDSSTGYRVPRSGCAARALDDVGGWDERYFMYLEDTDLCWRLRKSGWEVAYEPAGVVVHVQGASASRRPYRMLLEHHRSAWRFARARFTGVRAVMLPFVAVFFSLRAVMAMTDHAWRSSRSRPSR